MSQRFTVNTTKGSLGTGIAVVHANTSGHVDRASANATHAANTAGETVSALFISEVAWSSSSSNSEWALRRGGNTVFRCYGQNGLISFKDENLKLEAGGDAQANVVFDLLGPGEGDIVIKLRKQSGAD